MAWASTPDRETNSKDEVGFMTDTSLPGRLALLVGGGPAPGINGVISAATIEAIEQGIEVIGFRTVSSGWSRATSITIASLSIDDVKAIHLRGGSILGTSRTNPTKSEEDMGNVLDTLRRLNVAMLLTIGGDDTAFSGSQVYAKAGGTIRVAHVPKTIDNDLPLPGSTPTFGFETARHFGVDIVRNLAEDARTTSRWYLIISMGRAAGHLALGIGKAAAATLTIIPEEFGDRHVTLDEVCDVIIGTIIKRRSDGTPTTAWPSWPRVSSKPSAKTASRKCMSSGQLGRYGKIVRDPHGHLRLGEIEFGRMIKDRLQALTGELGLQVTLIDKDLGYELRCADPIPFDAEYTRDLGYGAVKFLRSAESSTFGAIICLVGGHLRSAPVRRDDQSENGPDADAAGGRQGRIL